MGGGGSRLEFFNFGALLYDGTEKQPIKPKTNSMSPEKEQLAEWRENCLDLPKQILIDRSDDPGIYWTPVRFDPRFPNTDSTNWCYTSFTDYYRCRKLRGPDYEPCNFYKNAFEQICPNYMIERWENARANGTFFPNV